MFRTFVDWLVVCAGASAGDAGGDSGSGSRADVCQAVTELEEIGRIARRRYGASHPQTGLIQRALDRAKAKLARLDAGA